MKNSLFYLLLISVVSAFCAGCSRAGVTGRPSAKYFVQLDSLLDNQREFQRKKELRIEELKHKEAKAVSDADHYMAAALLFDEYSIYNSERAIDYADKMMEYARKCGNRDWEIHSLLSKANVLAAAGLLQDSEEIMRGINSTTLSQDQKTEYYGQMMYLLSHQGNYAGTPENRYYDEERLYKDSVTAIVSRDHPMYLWYKSWDVLGSPKDDPSLIPALEKKLASSKFDTREDAMNAYVLGKLYEEAGDQTNYERATCLSAMADVRIANAEIASLQELGGYVFRNGTGDIDRAYRYINYSLNKAISFPNRVRAVSITNILDCVNRAYQERLVTEQHRSRLWLIIVCLFAAALIGMLFFVRVQNRRLRRQGKSLDKANSELSASLLEISQAQEQIKDANGQLEALNSELNEKNDSLSEANNMKEEYIASIFSMCSSYITKHEDFRTKVSRLLKDRKFEDALHILNSPELSYDEIKDLYANFDRIFLQIYPDFVSDFNTLLRPEEQIVLKNPKSLTTELRIYALVRLGLNDSTAIARFLHCSVQTVYNTRQRTRNKSDIPKGEFASRVQSLGRASI